MIGRSLELRESGGNFGSRDCSPRPRFAARKTPSIASSESTEALFCVVRSGCSSASSPGIVVGRWRIFSGIPRIRATKTNLLLRDGGLLVASVAQRPPFAFRERFSAAVPRSSASYSWRLISSSGRAIEADQMIVRDMALPWRKSGRGRRHPARRGCKRRSWPGQTSRPPRGNAPPNDRRKASTSDDPLHGASLIFSPS